MTDWRELHHNRPLIEEKRLPDFLEQELCQLLSILLNYSTQYQEQWKVVDDCQLTKVNDSLHRLLETLRDFDHSTHQFINILDVHPELFSRQQDFLMRVLYDVLDILSSEIVSTQQHIIRLGWDTEAGDNAFIAYKKMLEELSGLLEMVQQEVALFPYVINDLPKM